MIFFNDFFFLSMVMFYYFGCKSTYNFLNILIFMMKLFGALAINAYFCTRKDETRDRILVR